MDKDINMDMDTDTDTDTDIDTDRRQQWESSAMGESVTEQCHVEVESSRVINSFSQRRINGST